MKTSCLRLALLLVAIAFVTNTDAAVQGSFALLHSLFDPGTNTQPSTSHGSSVAIDRYIVVAALPDDDSSSIDSGVVNIYATNGVLLHTLVSPTGSPDDRFGSAVATSGTRIVVGAEEATLAEIQPGSAYVYDLASITPTIPVLSLTNPSPGHLEHFGHALAIDGKRVIIGAPQDITGAPSAGSAYVYDLASSMPTVPITVLTNPGPRQNDFFGSSAAISGTRVAVGAHRDNTVAFAAGSAYVYDLAGVLPSVPLVTLNDPSAGTRDFFGYSLAITGTHVVVGAHQDNTDGFNSGRAYLYSLTASNPTIPVATFSNPTPGPSDYFGYSVAISGTRTVIGAPWDNTGARGAGSAYIYDFASATPTVPVVTLNNPNSGTNDSFGFSVALQASTVLAGAPDDDSNASSRGAAYVFGVGPTLRITPAAHGFATLSWTPTGSIGTLLQYADSFSPTNWLDVLSGETNSVTVSITNALRFYRLFQP